MLLEQADFSKLVPEMSTLDAPTFELFEGLAEGNVNLTRFPAGSKRTLALAYMTAHLISVCPPSGISPQGGAVASESVGGVSVSYAVAARAAQDLSLSRYGLAFQRLARFAGAGGFVP